MSHEIIRRIDIRDGKVYMKIESNNCWPHYWDEHEEPYFSKLYQKEGQEGLDRFLIHGLLHLGTEFKGTEKGMSRYRKAFESEKGKRIQERYHRRMHDEFFGDPIKWRTHTPLNCKVSQEIEEEATEGLMALLGW